MCIKKIFQLDEEDEDDDLDFNISDFKDIQEILCDKKDNKYQLVTRRIDSSRIRHKIVKNIEVYTSQLKNVKMNMENPVRCGVIVYTHYKGKTYFCLGVDSSFGDLTDFGGGMKKNENAIECGLRELEEESQGIFGKIEEEDVKNDLGFYCKNMMIMFIHRKVDIVKIKEDFSNKIKENEEVSNIEWIETKDFIDIISGRGKRMYSRVKRILQKVTDIISAL